MLIDQNHKFLTSIFISLITVLILEFDNKILIFFFNVFFILGLLYFLENKTEIPFKKSTSKKIPKKIFITYFDKKKVPNKVWKNLNFFGKGYKILFFSDEDCINYLDRNFGKKFSKKFQDIKLGAHKADFFRYCILLNEGGIYLDIDLKPREKFNKIFDHKSDKIFYTVISNTKLQLKNHKISKFKKLFRRLGDKSEKTIFQAMIATYPNNPIFKKLIKDFWNINNLHLKHDIITIKFFYRLKDLVSNTLEEGSFITKNNDTVILFSERNKKLKKSEKPDRTGSYPKIFDKNRVLFHFRYSGYP